jgi:hypothetical protein
MLLEENTGERFWPWRDKLSEDTKTLIAHEKLMNLSTLKGKTVHQKTLQRKKGWPTDGRQKPLTKAVSRINCPEKVKERWVKDRGRGKGWRRAVEGVNSTIMYLICCKNFCKYHNVPPAQLKKKTYNEKNTTAYLISLTWCFKMINFSLEFCFNVIWYCCIESYQTSSFKVSSCK